MVDVIRTIILPILLIAIAVVFGMRYTETFFDIGSMGSGGSNNVGSNSSNILFGKGFNILTSTTNNCGSNISSNISSNITASSIYHNIIGQIADNSVAGLKFDMLYDGRSKDKINYISQEHKDASEAQEDALTSKDVKDMIQNELLSKLSQTTANQMYFDDQEECEDSCSPATEQGCELDESNRRRKMPPIDMNQYVRKDSIPCWGCNLE
jgi:hypothetical protein